MEGLIDVDKLCACVIHKQTSKNEKQQTIKNKLRLTEKECEMIFLHQAANHKLEMDKLKTNHKLELLTLDNDYGELIRSWQKALHGILQEDDIDRFYKQVDSASKKIKTNLSGRKIHDAWLKQVAKVLSRNDVKTIVNSVMSDV